MKVLDPKEKSIFYLLLSLLLASLLGWGVLTYFSKTEAVADFGGEYIEGIVGQPAHINPVISQSNNVDEDLVQLIYSGLLKYDSQGQLIPDLAENYEVSEDKKTFTFHLKKNVAWHDEMPLTAEDVLFTANLLSDPSYKSPLRSNWQGVRAELIDDHTIAFTIETQYVGFLNNLTFGILPKHIWESANPDKFYLTDLNLEPIGSGPYKFSALQKDSNGNILSYKLVANQNYFLGKPYISKITLNFYTDDEAILEAYNTKEIMGISNLSSQKISGIKLLQSTAVHTFSIPRYFSVFINQTKSVALAHDEVRKALAYATDRQAIVKNILGGKGHPVYAPILQNMVGHSDSLEKYDFDLGKANQILDDSGWTRGDDGVRSKNGTVLEFELVTTDWTELIQTAEILKEQWKTVGIRANIVSSSISDIQQNYIRPREYDALLFGQVLGADPDPFSFWHSSQKRDPGLNLALFGDSDTDKLIEDGRAEFDREKRSELYRKFQENVLQDVPAVFLYSPDYVYPVNKKVGGIDVKNLIAPAKRFSEINTWYINTKRIWK